MDHKPSVERLNSIAESLSTMLFAELAKGCENLDAKECGEVMDMIKDCYEAENYINQACYYKNVSEAMEKADVPIEGRGRYGYTDAAAVSKLPVVPPIAGKPYVDKYLEDPVRFRSEMRMNPHDNYQESKRHYMATKSIEDKNLMETYGHRSADEAYANLKELWRDATPEMKSNILRDVEALLSTFRTENA